MTFETEDLKAYSSYPFQLFNFSSGGDDYYFTTADQEITYVGNVYLTSSPMKSAQISEDPEDSRGKLTFEVDNDHPVVLLFRVVVPRTVSLRIFAGHVGSSDYLSIWQGVVTNVIWKDDGKATIECESTLMVMKRMGLHYDFGPLCGHTVYRGGCGLDINANSVFTTIDNLSGRVVTASPVASAPTSDHYVGGVLIFNNRDYRLIEAQSGSTVTINRQIAGLQIGDSIQIAAGCDRSSVRCKVLGNFPRFLGWETVPEKDLFKDGLE